LQVVGIGKGITVFATVKPQNEGALRAVDKLLGAKMRLVGRFGQRTLVSLLVSRFPPRLKRGLQGLLDLGRRNLVDV
jgi:hypothetical protein